ncbi:MAG: YihY/virulence factor BrkB family protein [Pseudonocardiales bacterium]|nr:YihY/virulence factor BrkB family protein [Pseudonocardiales bacterium]
MSGEPARHGQPRRRTWLRRAQVTAVRRVEYWQHSALVRRLQAADVINEGLLFAAVLLLCFLPFLLVIESLSGRTNASGFIRRFGLTGDAAQAVRQALTSPTAPSAAVSGLSWVFLILGGIAAAGAIQQLYERVFEVKGRRFRNTPRRVVWLAAALGVCIVGAWTQPWLHRVGGTGLVAIAALPAATAFWWFSMWLLLAGKVDWRELFPSALATGICWLGMVIVFRLTLSSTIASDYRKYGSAGVVFAIMTLLIAIGVVIILGALLGVVWRERREHSSGEQPGSSDQRDGLLPVHESCGWTGPMAYLMINEGAMPRRLQPCVHISVSHSVPARSHTPQPRQHRAMFRQEPGGRWE